MFGEYSTETISKKQAKQMLASAKQRRSAPFHRRAEMVRVLRSTRKYRWNRALYWAYQSGPRVFSDEEIKLALAIESSEWRAIMKFNKPRRWSEDKIRKKIYFFAKRHGRWPRSSEMEWPKHRENDLPPRSSLSRYFPWRGGRFEWISSRATAIEETIVAYWEGMTPQLILAIENVTIRRAMMERYGIEKLLHDGGGVAVQQDDYGTLWELPTDNPIDNRMLYVEVENKSPEPDGTFAHYFLRVPPGLTTAREAVAWTFDVEPSTLEFVMET